MTVWTPDWQILVNGYELSDVTLVGMTITSGRTSINSQAQAGYCQFEIVNLNNEDRSINVNTSVLIKIKDSTGTYVSLFGGRVSDVSIGVRAVGSATYVTSYTVTALGSIARLQKAVYTDALAQDHDGDQIYTVLSDLLLNRWTEVPPADTWATYSTTETWAEAQDLGVGEIDRPGEYEMEQRSADPVDFYTLITDIANSALGYIYEDSSGNIGYADAAHRQSYLIANGYTILSANDALGVGIRATTRQGALVNKFVLNYGNNFNSQVTSQSTQSQALYGLYGITQNSLVHDATDAQSIADRYVQLRAYPRAAFEGITYAIQNPEIDDADRDALLNVFMGQPVRITDLPAAISGGQFEGYVEGWTWRATVSGLSLTLIMTPTEFSAVAQNWDQVSALEKWNTLNNTLKWENAIGVIS